MFDYLVDHAVKNAWCSPRQDLQVILKPARISSARGVHASSPHMWGNIPMPTAHDLYYLYQVGQLHPALVGLLPERRMWHRLSTIMQLENLIADVYTNGGLHFPRFETWVLVTEERNLLLAVKAQPKIANLKTESIYFRLYSNAYFGSDRADATIDKIVCEGLKVSNTISALNFQRRYLDFRALPGLATLYVNGVFVDNYLPSRLDPGDIVEFVYDPSVKAVIDFDIEDLETFESTLDSKFKYLLHYPDPQVGGVGIDYRDDIDVYLISKSYVNDAYRWNGVYFHKNQDDAFRQVTHRDYAVAVPYALGYLSSRPEWLDINDLTIRLHIRNSGYSRPLIYEHHRIHELYKLGQDDIRQAMIGSDSGVAVWQAASLEASDYPKVMDSYYEQLTNQLIQDAYGYNAISKLVADTPQPVVTVNGLKQVELPYALRNNSTIYEYDSNGHLLGYHQHLTGDQHFPVHPNAALIEGIVGLGSEALDTLFNSNVITLDPLANYRFYRAPIVSGDVQHQSWADVTGDTSSYGVVGNVATWLISLGSWAVAVKSDKKFLAYDFMMSPENGLLKFSVDADADYPGNTLRKVMYIPLGQFDIWLNGKALIENLDYFVKWPQIVITNKAYLVEGDEQHVTVRASGFCRSDMSREPAKEVGFVKYGLMSRNVHFDVRDDKVVRIVAAGATHHRSALLYSEEDHGVRMANVANGSPYVVQDVVVPLRGLVAQDTYSFRAESKAVDQTVEDYLTLKLPETVRTLPDMIVDKYPIYSPFCSTIMHDMINDSLPMTDFMGQYSDKKVRDFLSAYLYLLEYDPTQKTIDTDYVAIHPHNLNVETQLNLYQYNFLNRAIRIYLADKVDITRFVSISNNVPG